MLTTGTVAADKETGTVGKVARDGTTPGSKPRSALDKGTDSMNRNLLLLGLISGLAILSASPAHAQVPAVGAAPAIPGAPVAPAAPAQANLWSFLLPNADQKFACKTAFCNSPLGMMFNSAAGPVSAMSGGLLGKRCEQNSIQQDLMKPADDPEGLAARVKNDEAEAIERRKAVRFLGTVDCNRWPEAIAALKNALRKDRNECVRFEAALALRNGCCCNNEIIDALKNSVLGENKTDPNPVEKSDRVRAVAAEALALCPMVHEEPKKDPTPLVKADPKLPTDPAEYYRKIAQVPREEMAASARAVLASLKKGGPPPQQPVGTEAAAPVNIPPAPALMPRNNSITGIVANAFVIPSPVNGTRQPFFSSLTKSLTGSQETGAPARNDLSAPLPAGSIPVRDRPAPESRPFSISSQIFDHPMESLVEGRTSFSPPRDLAPPREAATQLEVQLVGPSQANLGTSVTFEIRIANRSSHSVSGLALHASLPDNLTHLEGREIKGMVQSTIPPGETKTLQVSAVAVGAGPGRVRVKVVSPEGEFWAGAEIVCNAPPMPQLPPRAEPSRVAPPRVAPPRIIEESGNQRNQVVQPHAPVENGMLPPRIEPPINPMRGSSGTATIEPRLPSDFVLPDMAPLRR